MPLPQPEPFVAHKEERLVLDHPPTDIGAELILRERRSGNSGAVVEESVGVQNLIPKELVGRAVKIVGAGFRSHVDHATGKTAELRAEVIRLNTKFLD